MLFASSHDQCSTTDPPSCPPSFKLSHLLTVPTYPTSQPCTPQPLLDPVPGTSAPCLPAPHAHMCPYGYPLFPHRHQYAQTHIHTQSHTQIHTHEHAHTPTHILPLALSNTRPPALRRIPSRAPAAGPGTAPSPPACRPHVPPPRRWARPQTPARSPCPSQPGP